ncbi:hypothetical protein Q9966_014679 [Columba livia]|nr:hypothetical protein Q9966_014679 [Columba livia]
MVFNVIIPRCFMHCSLVGLDGETETETAPPPPASEVTDLGTSLNGNEMGKISYLNSNAIPQILCVSSCDLLADNV